MRRSCGAAAERCVTITVHVPTPCRCSLLAASDPLSRPLTPAYGRPRWLLHLPPALGGKNPMCRKLRKSHTRHCLNRTRRPTSLGDSGHRHWANTSLRALRAVAPPLLSGLRGVVFGHLKGFGKVLITGSPLLAQSESQLRAGRAPPQVALRPTAHVKRHAVAPGLLALATHTALSYSPNNNDRTTTTTLRASHRLDGKLALHGLTVGLLRCEGHPAIEPAQQRLVRLGLGLELGLGLGLDWAWAWLGLGLGLAWAWAWA